MPQYKKITPEEADAYVALKIPFKWIANGMGDCWIEWDYGERGYQWTPSEYPQDTFCVEVE